MNKLRANRKAAIAAIVAGDVIVLLLGWFMLIGPQRAEAQQIAQSTAATESQISQANEALAPLVPAAVQKQPDIRTADLYALAKAMPSDEDTPDLLLELNLLARESGITLKAISPSGPTPAASGSFSLVPISLTAVGNFYGLTDYLYRLRTLVGVRDGELQTAGRLYSVGDVSISQASGPTLTASLTVSAYLWGGASTTPTATVPAATTTSTDTTATSTTSAPPAN